MSEATNWLTIMMTTGRFSTHLATLLDEHIAARSLHFFMVLDEIAALEQHPRSRPSLTKPHDRFRGRWLRGLNKKHFMQPAYLMRNIANHWKNRFNELHKIEPSQVVHHALLEGYKKRAWDRQLTGQYIIFAEQADVKYYLTLGIHQDDESIWRRCQLCADEFPELFLLQENRG